MYPSLPDTLRRIDAVGHVHHHNDNSSWAHARNGLGPLHEIQYELVFRPVVLSVPLM